MPTTKTRFPFFGQNLILTFTGCNQLGKIDAIQLQLQKTDALRFGQHCNGGRNVISKAIHTQSFFNSEKTLRAPSLARSNYRRQRGDRIAARYDLGGMKKSIYLVAMLGLFAACEQKTTTVNPPAEKKESNTTIVNPPSEKKETNTTVVNPPGSSTTTKEEKTDINVNTSPNP
jgi:hypothetical protein